MPKTYNELYADARRRLREKDISSYSLEAKLILACACGKTKDELPLNMNLYTSSQVTERVESMLKRRLEGEPVAYITGEWEFYGLPIALTRDVLIPRMDTEVLANTAINTLKGKKMDARIIDLCTGSGCVGCAIAKALPASRVVLADNSVSALAVAKQNVMKNRLNPRVTCIEADVRLKPPMMLGSFDIMVCNPPYIPTAEIETLDASVRDFEPVEALDGGADGLDFYRAILENWRGVIKVGGAMIFEVGAGQANDVKILMRLAGFKDVGTEKDTLGIERVVYGNG